MTLIPREADLESRPSAHRAKDAVPRAAWAPYAQMLLGCWLMAGAFTFGYSGRPEAWSDLAGGFVLVLLAAGSLKPAWGVVAQWSTGLVSVWLMLAPLVFWAPDPAAYVNSTLAGCLALTFSLLFPRNALERDVPVSSVPRGWSYNPSAWSQRIPLIAMAFLGFFIAQYMAAFQLGYHDAPWDPFFGDGTRRVLTSDVSRSFPVSDAGLGAVAYLVEALTGFAGGPRRWRTMPWMVLLFGVMVVPAGVVSILLITLQPIAVGAWCGFCLVTAVTTLMMISPAADEIVATLQFLSHSRRAGAPLWKTFWLGARPGHDDVSFDGSTPASSRPPSGTSWLATSLGVSAFTPSLVLSALLGIWLMFAPVFLGGAGASKLNDQLIGPLVITVAGIAFAEIGRMVRWLNVPLGIWLIASSWWLTGASLLSRSNDVIVGILLVMISIPRGKIVERFGGFNRYIV